MSDEVTAERQRIVEFLREVYETATHGSSDLMRRAIEAVAANEMDDMVADEEQAAALARIYANGHTSAARARAAAYLESRAKEERARPNSAQ